MGKLKKKKKTLYTSNSFKYTFNKIMIQMKEKLQPTTGLSQSFFWNLNDFYLSNYLYYN